MMFDGASEPVFPARFFYGRAIASRRTLWFLFTSRPNAGCKKQVPSLSSGQALRLGPRVRQAKSGPDEPPQTAQHQRALGTPAARSSLRRTILLQLFS